MHSRNILDQLGLGFVILGILGQWFFYYSWMVAVVGGIVYIASCFYPKREVGDVLFADLVDIFLIRKAPINVRLVYYTMIASVLTTMIVFARSTNWFVFAILVGCVLVGCHILNWYWANRNVTPHQRNDITAGDVMNALLLPDAPLVIRTLVWFLDALMLTSVVLSYKFGFPALAVALTCAAMQGVLVRKYRKSGLSVDH